MKRSDRPSPSMSCSLEQVIERLKRQEMVRGVLLIGSLATGTFNPASDYDLVIVIDPCERLWYVGVTHIEQRFTDLIFVSQTAVERAGGIDSPVDAQHELAPILRWLKAGQIVYDPDGFLQGVQSKLLEQDWSVTPAREAAYEAWFALNYNLAQTRRLLGSSDDAYQGAAFVRIAVYGYSDLWFGYYAVRQWDWPGDKAAYRYLQDAAPEFLDVYERFVRAVGPEEKLALYEKAAALAAEPFGGLWPADITLMNVENNAIWKKLMAE